MAGDYATIEQVRAYGYQSTERDDPILTDILPRASRLFDQYCGLPPGYFDAYDGTAAASARKFWGNGTNFLKVDPYLSTHTPTVAMPTGWATPTFIESNPFAHPQQATANGEFYLLRTYGDSESLFDGLHAMQSDLGASFNLDLSSDTEYGWPQGVRATVTAKWGWDAIPADVTEAVAELAIAIWRGRDQAFARVVNLETSQQIFGALPERAKLIGDKYRIGKAMFA